MKVARRQRLQQNIGARNGNDSPASKSSEAEFEPKDAEPLEDDDEEEEEEEDSDDEEEYAGSQEFHGSLDGTGLRIGIVIARFNELITKPLLTGAKEMLERHWVDVDEDVDVSWRMDYWRFERLKKWCSLAAQACAVWRTLSG